MNYRVSNDKLIPYIEMNFEKIKREIIKKVFIGPRSKIEKMISLNSWNFMAIITAVTDIILMIRFVSENPPYRINDITYLIS